MINFGKGVVNITYSDFDSEFILLFPAALGYFHTRVNYDILTYLPKEIDTMKGQDILLDEFGTGAFSMCVVRRNGRSGHFKDEKEHGKSRPCEKNSLV